MSRKKYINPLSLNDGTKIDEKAICDWVERGLEEDYYVELKEYGGKNDTMPAKIRKTVAAFANSYGGYLLLGIKDIKNLQNHADSISIDKRIVGVSVKDSDARNFVNGICHNTLMYPRIENLDAYDVMIGKNRVIVVRVPKVDVGPIGFKDDAKEPVKYYKRINGDSTPMDYTDVKEKFEASNLALVRSVLHELFSLHWVLKGIRDDDLSKNMTSSRIEMALLSDLSNCYRILDFDFDTFMALSNLKSGSRHINHVVQLINESHVNNQVIGNMDTLIDQIEKTIDGVDEGIATIQGKIIGKYPSVADDFKESADAFLASTENWDVKS